MTRQIYIVQRIQYEADDNTCPHRAIPEFLRESGNLDRMQWPHWPPLYPDANSIDHKISRITS